MRQSLRYFAVTALFVCSMSIPPVATSEDDIGLSSYASTALVGMHFPVTIVIGPERIYLTEPEVLFVSDSRVAIRTRFQAYDHRPEDNVKISETGTAKVSGTLDFDLETREFLLRDPRLDILAFDSDSMIARRMGQTIMRYWAVKIGNPVRASIPEDHYLNKVRDYITGMQYDGEQIMVEMDF